HGLKQTQAEGVKVQLELSGKRAIAYFRFQGIPAERTFTHFEDKPTFEEVEVLANRYLADYIAGKIDRVEVAYMKFINAAKQVPVVETLLPLSSLAPDPSRPSPSGRGVGGEGKPAKVEYEFIPSAKE